MAESRIELLSKKHDRRSFSCGNLDLDRWFRESAGQAHDKGALRCHVLTPDGQNVYGFYASTSSTIQWTEIQASDLKAQRLPQHGGFGATLIARLAVANERQGKGAGRFLLGHALDTTLHTHQTRCATPYVVVDAKEGSKAFYLKAGFKESPTDRFHLYLPIHVYESNVRQAQESRAQSSVLV